jgi:hypothetical protein
LSSSVLRVGNHAFEALRLLIVDMDLAALEVRFAADEKLVTPC